MNKKVVIIVILLVVCCCLTTLVGGILLGYLATNGQCVYKGPFASVQSGPCASSTSSSSTSTSSTPTGGLNAQTTYAGRNSDLFTFKYDSNVMTLDDRPSNSALILTLTAKDYGTFKDNLNITSAQAMDITKSNCQQYGVGVITQIKTQYSVSESTYISEVVQMGDNEVCHVGWDASSGTIRFTQNQYLFTDMSGDKTYIVTTSTEKNGSNKDLFDAVLESFELMQ